MDAAKDDIERLLAHGKIVVIDFHASWCAPCKAYSPKFARIAREVRRQNPQAAIEFVAVDIDQQQDIAREAKIRSVPTTLAWVHRRSWLGRIKKRELLRFSGDRRWEEMQRSFLSLVHES